jgi:hypothetical protein
MQGTDEFLQLVPIDYKIFCSNAGQSCGSTIVCNLTVIAPDESLYLSNAAMIYNQNFFNYTIPNTTIGGIYKTNTVCCLPAGALIPASCGMTESHYRIVYVQTPYSSDSALFGLLALIPILLAIAISIIVHSFDDEHKTLKLLFLIIIIFLGVIGLGFALMGAGYVYQLNELVIKIAQIQQWVTWLAYLVLTYIAIYLIYKVITFLATKGEGSE